MNSIEKEIYMSDGLDVIDAKKLLEAGKLIQVRTHTRFIHFPKHTHNYVEMIYMCSGSTHHVINGEDVVLNKGELLMLNQNAVQEIYPAREEDIAVNFIILPEFFDYGLKMIEEEENLLHTFIVDCLREEHGTSGYLHFKVADVLPIQPGAISKIGNKATSLIPQPVKQAGKVAKNAIAEQELFIQCMKVVTDGFGILEKQAARLAVPENAIIKRINEASQGVEINSVDAICLARGYDISKIVSGYKTQDRILALVEGGATGAFGFAGLPFNIVLSTFLYYRAVQSIALHYGYDIKNDASELVIASDVFMSALSPESKGMNEATELIGKIMVMTEITTVKQVSKKTWE